MIKTARPMPAPADVSAALQKKFVENGLTERAAAEAYYNVVPRPSKSYDFKRYREIPVVQALNSLFNGKCAYCESAYIAVDALDVEHFRPKAGVDEAPNHPGYWWLAADWTNLLPSCPPCNQRRKQAEFQLGMSFEEIERALLSKPSSTSGKANAFPVLGNNWVTAVDADLSVEDPLLINPCERDPDDYMEWVFDRDLQQPIWKADPVVPFLRPKLVNGGDDPHGEASIKIFGLNRVGVVKSRVQQIKVLQGACPPILDVLDDLGDEPDATTARAIKLLARLRDYKALLLQHAMPGAVYAGMARAFVREFEADLDRLGP